jgi:hypothetical protein
MGFAAMIGSFTETMLRAMELGVASAPRHGTNTQNVEAFLPLSDATL